MSSRQATAHALSAIIDGYPDFANHFFEDLSLAQCKQASIDAKRLLDTAIKHRTRLEKKLRPNLSANRHLPEFLAIQKRLSNQVNQETKP